MLYKAEECTLRFVLQPGTRQIDDFMARLEIGSLNLVAEVLRKAQPLYQECAKITNYLDPSGAAVLKKPATETE